jgi:hypothetical protein
MLDPLSYTNSPHRQESNLRLLVPMYPVPSPRRTLYKSAQPPPPFSSNSHLAASATTEQFREE